MREKREIVKIAASIPSCGRGGKVDKLLSHHSHISWEYDNNNDNNDNYNDNNNNDNNNNNNDNNNYKNDNDNHNNNNNNYNNNNDNYNNNNNITVVIMIITMIIMIIKTIIMIMTIYNDYNYFFHQTYIFARQGKESDTLI